MGCPPYGAKVIGNYFIKTAKDEGEFLTPMKLQKLIYFAHGWCLALTETPLINEYFEAWKYGPVAPSVFYEFREFGGEPIRRYASTAKVSDLDGDEFTIALLNKIWDEFGTISAIKLSAMTHLPDSPWEQTRAQTQNEKKVNAEIDDELVKNYFLTEFMQTAV